MQTQTYEVPTYAADAARAILDSYARLTFTERKGSWWRLTAHQVFFDVSGPREWLDKAAADIKQTVFEAWGNESW